MSGTSAVPCELYGEAGFGRGANEPSFSANVVPAMAAGDFTMRRSFLRLMDVTPQDDRARFS
jgi:hypothetical protein